MIAALLALFWAHSLKKQDTTVQPNALIGKPAPTAVYPPLNGGQPVRAAALLNGRPGLINVFGSWCGPCAVEAPQ
jgi:cytochrome c biogenesis protein CcmG/thiol:disulfide interchange protein DsbE